MQKVCLDFDWSFGNNIDVAASMGVVPDGCTSIDLPFCTHSDKAYFYKKLVVEKYDIRTTTMLELFGVQGLAELYVNGNRVGTVSDVYSCVDISQFLCAPNNVLMIVVSNLHGSAGIAGGVNLVVIDSAVHIDNNGVFATTKFCSANFAFLNFKVDLRVHDKLFDMDSYSSICKKLRKEPIEVELLLEIFNPKGRRSTKRLKKIKFKRNSTIDFNRIKINKPHLFCAETPKVYSVKATLMMDGTAVSYAQTNFGIRTFAVRKKKFALNNRLMWLNGLKLDNKNGIMGAVSTLLLEQRKLNKIKSFGYNSVSVKGLPSNAFLDACDLTGMLCMVELVDNFFQDKPYETFIFEREHQNILTNHVKILRNHPSVVIYSVADCNSYTYGRKNGIQFVTKIIDIIKSIDSTRSITGAVTELLPTVEELDTYTRNSGYKKIEQTDQLVKVAQAIGHQKDIFRYATQEFCDLLDFVCYKDLTHRYQKDTELFPMRRILGVDTPTDKIDKLDMDDLKYKNNILGDFSDGSDFDSLGNAKPTTVYRQILDGAKNKSAIATYQPENKEPSVSQGQDSWDYAGSNGEKVLVDVFTSGDIVALYLDDEIIGRKLAGRLYNRKTRFEVDYKPGVLKAVSYFKGTEHCTEQLSSTGTPKALSLKADKKYINLNDRRDLMIVDLKVVDQNFRVVSFASREVLLTVTPECEIVAYGNANPKYVVRPPDENGEISLPIYEGRAQVVLRGVSEGQAILTAFSAGLRTAKLKINVRVVVPKSKVLSKNVGVVN
ncbi:MAG: DUF4982 domain-containing protein [Clostridiales bacterium]|jgi:beta-galactosidase|nr:DUF4982 domain-containing protein [Clostridiales bacterium]